MQIFIFLLLYMVLELGVRLWQGQRVIIGEQGAEESIRI
jgi:hypothetical protein